MAEKLIFAEQKYSGFTSNSDFDGLYMQAIGPEFALALGKTYRVVWDGESHTCAAHFGGSLGMGTGVLVLGNGGAVGLEGNNAAPFLIGWSSMGITLIAFDQESSHDLAIYEVVTEETKNLILSGSFDGFTEGIFSLEPGIFELTSGETYRVIWDGEEHTLTAVDINEDGVSTVAIGNLMAVGMPDNGVPFAITYTTYNFDGVAGSANALAHMTDTSASHTIAIYQVVAEETEDIDYLIKGSTLTAIANSIRAKTGTTDPIKVSDMATTIGGITGSGSGGSSEDLCYVTFMSHDGTVTLGKKAVAVGDDCADPIARGVFAKPTRESDVQYNYTFAGWATTPNGGLDGNALKAVSEDRTLYANYISTLRTYTITYYDSDGTTVLKTEPLAYGTTPAEYTPSKSQHTFNGWVPEVAVVTGDVSYTAQWIEQVLFSGGSWADIAEICANGEHKKYFGVGNERKIPMTINGTECQLTAKIAGMDHDDLADGSGKAALSILFFTAPSVNVKWEASPTTSHCYADSGNDLRTTVESNMTKLPMDLQTIIKKVTKICTVPKAGESRSFDCFLWAPSMGEICSSYGDEYGVTYELIETNHILDSNSYDVVHVTDVNGYRPDGGYGIWTRDVSWYYDKANYVKNGSVSGVSTTEGYGYIFGFCI